MQMDSNALEATIGGRAARRSPMQVLLDIEGPDSTFQQDVTDYFCYAQLAQQVSCCTFVTTTLLRASRCHMPALVASNACTLCSLPLLVSGKLPTTLSIAQAVSFYRMTLNCPAQSQDAKVEHCSSVAKQA